MGGTKIKISGLLIASQAGDGRSSFCFLCLNRPKRGLRYKNSWLFWGWWKKLMLSHFDLSWKSSLCPALSGLCVRILILLSAIAPCTCEGHIHHPQWIPELSLLNPLTYMVVYANLMPFLSYYLPTVDIIFIAWHFIVKLMSLFPSWFQRWCSFLSSLSATSGCIIFFFIIKLRTFTFSLTGHSSWLLVGISRLPWLLLLPFGDVIKLNRDT